MNLTVTNINKIQKRDLLNKGFLMLPHFFSEAVADIIIAELIQCVAKTENRSYLNEAFYQKHKANNYALDNPHHYNPTLKLFALALIAPVAAVLMNEPQFHMSLIQHNSPDPDKQHGIPWHQDVDPLIGPNKFYNFIFYAQNCDEQIGGITLVPGSQQMGQLPAGDSYAPINGMQTLYPQKGDLLVIDGCCFHHVSKNRSLDDRIAYSVRYISAELQGNDALNIGTYRTGKYHYANKHDIS